MATDALPRQDTPYSTVRRWPRYKLNVPLRIILDTDGRTAIVQGRGTELNGGGLALFAGVELALGAEVAVEFTPPYRSEPIRVRCAVRDRNGYVYGMEFIAELVDECERVEQIRTALKAMGARMS